MTYFNYILWSVEYQSYKGMTDLNYIPAPRNSGRFRALCYSFTSGSQNRQQARGAQREIRGVGVAAHSGRRRLKYAQWLKRDPVRNCFLLPNEIFLLGLSPGALAVYSYLLCCEHPFEGRF